MVLNGVVEKARNEEEKESLSASFTTSIFKAKNLVKGVKGVKGIESF